MHFAGPCTTRFIDREWAGLQNTFEKLKMFLKNLQLTSVSGFISLVLPSKVQFVYHCAITFFLIFNFHFPCSQLFQFSDCWTFTQGISRRMKILKHFNVLIWCLKSRDSLVLKNTTISIPFAFSFTTKKLLSVPFTFFLSRSSIVFLFLWFEIK